MQLYVCSALKCGNMSKRHMYSMLRCGQCPSNLDLAAITFLLQRRSDNLFDLSTVSMTDSSCLSLTQLLYCQRFPAGSTMPERILSLPTTTASGKIISQCIVQQASNINKCIKVVAGGCSQFCVNRCIHCYPQNVASQCAKIDKSLFCLQDNLVTEGHQLSPTSFALN